MNMPMLPRPANTCGLSRNLIAAGIGLMVGLGCPATAFAGLSSSLPAPYYQVALGEGPGVTYPGPTFSAPGSYSYGAETGSLSVSPSPSLTVHAGGSLYTTNVAGAVLNYSFVVSGPASVDVPLLVMGSASTSASGLLVGAEADIDVGGYPGASVGVSTFGGPSSWAGFLAVSEYTNIPVGVGLSLVAYTQGGGSADASIDPVIEIDPSFPDASLYSITFSPGLGNSFSPAISPIPAPMSLSFLGTGLIGLLVARRRPA